MSSGKPISGVLRYTEMFPIAASFDSSITRTQTAHDARDEIIAQYQMLMRFCVQLTGSYADGEDAAQTSIEKALRHIEKTPGTAPPLAEIRFWLIKIARNSCYDLLRKLKRQVAALIDYPEETSTSKLSLEVKELLREVQALPKQQREVFILRQLHDLSTSEVARVLGLAEGTVKVHLKRAVDRLKEMRE